MLTKQSKIALIAIGFILLTGLVAFAMSPAKAGMWDAVTTMDWETKETKAYKLDVEGYDARAYEWTPADNPNVRCVFVASNKSSGVACYSVVQ